MSHDDERQCWLDAVKNVTPMEKARRVSIHAREENLTISPHKNKKRRSSSAQPKRAIRQRQLKFDRIIDLHGCSLSEAQHKVKQTIIHRHHERWFLFITGQGKKAGADDGFRGQGVILNHFPQWMRASSVRSHIIDFGAYGAGAYYVHVRR